MASTKLTKDQLATLRTWVSEGASMGDIQSKLKDELGLSFTYMETRLLLLDLDLTLREEQAEPEDKPAAETVAAEPEDDFADDPADASGDLLGASRVRVTIDEIVTPGALVSGKVVFSDGKSASWTLDQMGRLGLSGTEPGYKPSETDIVAFQKELQTVLQRQGY